MFERLRNPRPDVTSGRGFRLFVYFLVTPLERVLRRRRDARDVAAQPRRVEGVALLAARDVRQVLEQMQNVGPRVHGLTSPRSRTSVAPRARPR